MTWVDKINCWVLKRTRPQDIEKVETSASGITMVRASGGNQFIKWDDLKEVAVLTQPDFASGLFALVMHSGDSVLSINDSAAGFEQLCLELPRHLNGITPYNIWAVDLSAAGNNVSGRMIFRRHDAS